MWLFLKVSFAQLINRGSLVVRENCKKARENCKKAVRKLERARENCTKLSKFANF